MNKKEKKNMRNCFWMPLTSFILWMTLSYISWLQCALLFDHRGFLSCSLHCVWKSHRKVAFNAFNKNWLKMPRLKNSNEMFWVIFKHCAFDNTQFKIPRYIFKLQARKYFPVKYICHLRYLRSLQSTSLYYFSPFLIF